MGNVQLDIDRIRSRLRDKILSPSIDLPFPIRESLLDEIAAATSATAVSDKLQPGDLITAGLINDILRRLDALDTTPEVPFLIGKTLGEAMKVMTKAGGSIRKAIDVLGKEVASSAWNTSTLVVLNQVPPPNTHSSKDEMTVVVSVAVASPSDSTHDQLKTVTGFGPQIVEGPAATTTIIGQVAPP